MIRGARVLIETCANVQPNERVVIVTDRRENPVLDALVAAVLEKKAEPTICVMQPRAGHGLNPPEPVAKAMLAADVILAPTTDYSISHSPARVEACAAGARYLNLVGYRPDMLKEGGVFADYLGLAPAVKRVGSLFGEARTATIISKNGERITFDVSGRRGNAPTGLARARGEGSFPPAIQANTTPIEGKATGKIVIDGSIPMKGLGIVSEPVELEVEAGRIVKISGGREARVLHDYLAASGDPNDFMVTEIGVGLNPECRKLTGGLLEDEGYLAGVHVGIGENISLGGAIKSSLHLDVILVDASLALDDTLVVDRGKMALSEWRDIGAQKRG